jgi:soluble lytic murein transglycosylase
MNKSIYRLFIITCIFIPAIISSGSVSGSNNPPDIQLTTLSQSPIDAEESSSLAKNNHSLSIKFTEEELTILRQKFSDAENALARNNVEKYFLLADDLKEYPLYPYLQYKWLRKNLQHDTKIKQFLEQNETSRYARLLNLKWLHHLAKNGQWQQFLQHFTETKNIKLQCYYRQAQYNTGNKKAALTGAAKLWAVGSSQPDECDALFTLLKDSPYYNQNLLWRRFYATLRKNKVGFAHYVKKLMPSKYHATADLWINLHRDAENYLPELLNTPRTAQSTLMFSHAIHRLANSDIKQAVMLWDKHKKRYRITKRRADKLERRLALKLAYKKEAGAFDRLGKLNFADNKSKTTRIRVALAEQNWPHVITAINSLSNDEKKHENWRYWLARAYEKTGKSKQAEKVFKTLSYRRSFYGYLSADRVSSIYRLWDKPLQISTQKINNIRYRDDFSIAYEFKILGREAQAKYQWWHALKQLDKTEIKAAAKLAQQWQWDEVAIFTIAKVKHWDDIDLRFPLSYSDNIHENAIKQNINPALLFGLIRRESSFFKKAHSPVGARGLMQIMPNTGRQIAKDLKQRWRGKNSLYDPVKNIKYGSYYYKKLVKQFGGNYALALAAYNAGPHRVKSWLPKETLPADIWIEIIPFNETRGYVTTVLMYAMIYQLRNESAALSMADLTLDVHPHSLKTVKNSY